MNSAAKAIAWELWARNRWANLAVVVAIPLLAVFNSSWMGEWARVCEVLLFLFSITVLFWTFCYIEVDARGRHAGFPTRLFTLPMQTVALVGAPMIYGALTISVFYTLWSQLIFPQWGAPLSGSLLRVHLLTLTAMLFSVQAIVWSLHRFPWIRLPLLVVVLVALGVLGLAIPADFQAMSEAKVLVTLSSIALIACGGAIAGVTRDRRGEWSSWTQRLIDAVLAIVPRRRSPFSSADAAQVWFEWRGKAFFLSAAFALPMVCAVIFVPLVASLDFNSRDVATACLSVPLLGLVMAWCFGMTLAKTDYWSRNPELSSFVTARPLSDGDIVMAKLKAAALMIFAGGIIFTVLAIPASNIPYWLMESDLRFPSWTQFKSRHPELILKLTHPLVLVTAFGVMWATMIDGLALNLRGQVHSTTHFLARFGVFLAGLICVSWLARRPGGIDILVSSLPWASGALVIWKAASTAFYFDRARHLFSRRQLVVLTVLWLAIAGCITASAAVVWTEVSILNRIIVLFAAWLAPGSAIFRCALSLHANRHR